MTRDRSGDTSSARQLTQEDADAAQSFKLLTSVPSVVATIYSSMAAYFPQANVEEPPEQEVGATDCVSTTIDGFTQVFIGASVWNSPSRLRPFVDNKVGDAVMLVCMGSEEELLTLPPSCKKDGILQLGLPVTGAHLFSTMRTVLHLQKRLVTSQTESALVREATEDVKHVLSISRELNGERDIPKLLNLILQKAREICKADAGSIYTVESTSANIREGMIHFRFTQNHSIGQNLSQFKIPVSESSIVGNAVIHERTINIPDLYKLSGDPKQNEYGVVHDRSWDRRIGYESHSMMTLPMFDISHQVIGVIQLINRKSEWSRKLLSTDDFGRYVVPFDAKDQEYAEIVAQQAGIALENARMHEEIQKLFDGFVDASVKAIEQRDPTTSGHSHRVAKLTLEMAKLVDHISTGPYRDVNFNEDQLKEIEYASLLHDFGKLGVREAVLVKAKKLYPGQLENLHQRFDLIRASAEIEYLRKMINFYQAPHLFPQDMNPELFAFEREAKFSELEEMYEFILKSNEPTVLAQGGFDRLKDIAKMNFVDARGKNLPYINGEELKSLSVARGSLTGEEFAEIQSHVTHTYEFLRTIPWGRRLANVPQIAAKHHEKLDGTGYPLSAEADEIPIQSRMMSIADIFDALTAADRPYKKAVPVEKALDILNMEVKAQKIDPELFRILTESRIYRVVLDPTKT